MVWIILTLKDCGGRHPGSALSTVRELVKRSMTLDFPVKSPAIRSQNTGQLNIVGWRPRASETAVITSGVDLSSPSLGR